MYRAVGQSVVDGVLQGPGPTASPKPEGQRRLWGGLRGALSSTVYGSDTRSDGNETATIANPMFGCCSSLGIELVGGYLPA